MSTRFFKFPDMATAFALSQANGMTYTDENGEPWLIRFCHEWSIDVIGEIPEIPGWHINVRTGSEIPADFLQYEVFPATPVRDFA